LDILLGLGGYYGGLNLWLAEQRTDQESESDFVWKVKSGSVTCPMEYSNWDKEQADYFPHPDGKEACLIIWPDRGFK